MFAKLNKNLGGNKCVLYCGPSNRSVDVVFGKQWIIILFPDECYELFRKVCSTP